MATDGGEALPGDKSEKTDKGEDDELSTSQRLFRGAKGLGAGVAGALAGGARYAVQGIAVALRTGGNRVISQVVRNPGKLMAPFTLFAAWVLVNIESSKQRKARLADPDGGKLVMRRVVSGTIILGAFVLFTVMAARGALFPTLQPTIVKYWGPQMIVLLGAAIGATCMLLNDGLWELDPVTQVYIALTAVLGVAIALPSACLMMHAWPFRFRPAMRAAAFAFVLLLVWVGVAVLCSSEEALRGLMDQGGASLAMAGALTLGIVCVFLVAPARARARYPGLDAHYMAPVFKRANALKADAGSGDAA